jgi:predicted nucleic acid-binding Zn ribbon protein
MKKKEERDYSMKEAIQKLVASYGLNEKLAEKKIEEAWKKMAGPYIANRTSFMKFKNKTLTIKIESAVLSKELSMQKELIIRNLNQLLEGDFVEKLKIL